MIVPFESYFVSPGACSDTKWLLCWQRLLFALYTLIGLRPGNVIYPCKDMGADVIRIYRSERWFTRLVKKYNAHPAVLGWIFGNEVNAIWNGFLHHLNADRNCGWSERCHYVKGEGDCFHPRRCVYDAFFSWINDVGRRAIEAMQETGARKSSLQPLWLM